VFSQSAIADVCFCTIFTVIHMCLAGSLFMFGLWSEIPHPVNLEKPKKLKLKVHGESGEMLRFGFWDTIDRVVTIVVQQHCANM